MNYAAAAALARPGVLKGLWHYLIARAELRADIEKERERNRAFAAHREGLQGITELMDYEDHEGRKLWIRKCSPEGSRQGAQLPPTVIMELGSLPFVAIWPAGDFGPTGELRP